MKVRALNKKPNRTECMRMIGQLHAIAEISKRDASEQMSAITAALRRRSRAKVIDELINEACELIESLAPDYDKNGK